MGQTGYTMRARFAHHRYAFSSVHKSLYDHFINIHKTRFDVYITLLEQVDQRDLRLASENGWMDRLDTLLPHGLNTRMHQECKKQCSKLPKSSSERL